jgi:hypothetical protein
MRTRKADFLLETLQQAHLAPFPKGGLSAQQWHINMYEIISANYQNNFPTFGARRVGHLRAL